MTKIKFLFVFAAIVFATSLAQLAAQVSTWDGTHTPWTNGTGTEADPFLIENAQQLAYLTYRVNNGLDAAGGHVSNQNYYYKLMTDIDLNGSEEFQWTPIGYYTSSTDYQCFGGHFDGNNHTISGVHINSSTLSYVGLFGYTDGAYVSNLAVSGTSIIVSGDYRKWAGGIIGCTISSHVNNCSSSFSGEIRGYDAGGIIGYISPGSTTITNSYNTSKIKSFSNYARIGGIVGYKDHGVLKINNCYNTGSIQRSNTNQDNMNGSGGIVGYYNDIGSSYDTLTIYNCYNTGSINDANIQHSGGIVGYARNILNINSCYYLNTCGGNNTYGGTSMTIDGMQSAEFVDILNNGNYIWTQDIYYANQGFPIFKNKIYTYTEDATDVTQTQVSLNGIAFSTSDVTITSQGFEYKCASDTVFHAVNTENYGNLSYRLTDLVPGTQYIYRTFCTTSDNKTHYGTKRTFTTSYIQITTNAATNITESSAQLNGQMQIGDATLINKGFKYIKQGETDSTTIIVEGEDFIAQLYGLDVNTRYSYCAFVNIAENDITYYGYTSTFKTSWLYADTIPIYDLEMLQWVADMCNSGTTFEGKYIKLMNNIVLPLNQPNNMTSIGSYPDHPFKGTFDGNGKLITNLYIDQPNTPYQGFFGYTLDANLYNVGLVNITASGRNYTGGMVAYAENTNMRDCYVNGGSLFALSYCGGLVGYQTPGTNSIISGCYNTCTVSGNHYVGGLLGYSDYGTVRNSYVAASVAAQGEAVGSIIGGANEVLMYNCFFSSEITGQENAIGENNFKSNEGMSNEQMRDPQFVETLNQGLTIPVWKGDYEQPINNGFPILKWQYSEIETCGAPENLTSIVNGTSITLIWTGEDNVDYYIVEYGLAGEQAQTETTTRNTISFIYEQPGSYYWRVKSVCPFGESNFVNGENVEIVGIEEFAGIQQIGIYPNPASESVTIQSEGQIDIEQINVFDVNGRMVMSESATGQIHRLDISNLQQGIYFVKVQTSDGYMTNKKLIVQ